MVTNLKNLPARDISVGAATVTITSNFGFLALGGKIWTWEMLDVLMICRFQRPSLFTWGRLAKIFTGWKFSIKYEAIEVEAMFTYLSTVKLPEFLKYKQNLVLDVEMLTRSAKLLQMHITQPWKEFDFACPDSVMTVSLLVIFPLSHLSHGISIQDVLPIFQHNFASNSFPGSNWTVETLLQLHQFYVDFGNIPELKITLKSDIDHMDPSMQVEVAEDIRRLMKISIKGLGGEEFRKATDIARWDISRIMASYIYTMRGEASLKARKAKNSERILQA